MSFIINQFKEKTGLDFQFKAFESSGEPYFQCTNGVVFSVKNYETALNKGLVEEGENGAFKVTGELWKSNDGVTVILTGSKSNRSF